MSAASPLHGDSEFAGTDARFMTAALTLGRRWLGTTAPNPAVGAILVRNGIVVGHGATRSGGRPHAEVEALRQAGEGARGATLYVTLEPCSHYGRTPPCAEAIVAAGVSRVVSAIEDPDPRVAGRGHQRLLAAGIPVTVGVCAKEARRAHLGHMLRTTKGRPMVTLKLAETADGFAAAGDYDPRLRITGPAANHRVQILRALHEAIMVGAGTTRADDPLLTVRLPGMEDRRPLRVVVDSRASLSLRSRLASSARAWPTLVIAGEDAAEAAVKALIEAGVEVARVACGAGGVDLTAALESLAARAITRVFCEGGPTLASRLIAQGLADEVILFRGAMPLGRPGLPALSRDARDALAQNSLYAPSVAGFAGLDARESFARII